MQYTDYIKSYNDRIEREQQLLAQYNQKPIQAKNRCLWMRDIEQHSTHNITASHVFSIIGGIVLAGIILIASIWL